MTDRSHLSIGEVLSLLREEFPDVTISKIRFLESQGLVDPERTPSGYRKFYDHDVERLRWILRQQRENFLPLKVIRGRLTEHGEEIEEGSEEGEGAVEAPVGVGAEAMTARDEPRSLPERAVVGAERAARPAGETWGAGPAEPRQSNHPAATNRGAVTEPPWRGAPPAANHVTATSVPPVTTAAGDDTDSYSLEELAAATGGVLQMVKELQQYGLISSQAVVAGVPYFDAAALDVVRAATGFARHGVEVRHLKAWRNAAERESGLFEQIVMPLLRQRNPAARRRAADALAELAELGGDLRHALIEQAIRQIR